MKIWKLENDMQGYQSFQLMNKDKNFLKEFRNNIAAGRNQNGKFDNLKLEIIDSGIVSDFPKFWGFSGTLLCSTRAKICLADSLQNDVEFIPFIYEEEVYYVINVLRVLDVIDYEKATFRKLDTGLVIGIDNYAFKQDEMKNVKMFKLLLNGKNYYTETFITEDIKRRIHEFGLTGIRLVEV